ncbi:MAG: dockerin type I domain-containing protein [Planctomycetota bacterium]
MMLRFALATVLVALPWIPASAQGPAGTGGADPSGMGHEYTLTIPGATVPLGGTFDLPVHISGDDPILLVVFFSDVDPNALTINDISPGSALENYQTAFGPPPVCDIVIYPDSAGAQVVMVFGAPLEPAVMGTEFVVLHCEVTAPAPTTTQIVTMTDLGDVIETPITIVDEPLVQRGDVNGDAACDVTDAVRILQHLFLGDAASCPDAADVDDDGAVAVTDVVLLLETLFQGGAPIDEVCRLDLTPDALGCDDTACP